MSWRNLSGFALRRAKREVLLEAYLELSGQSGSGACSHPATKAGLLAEIEKLLAEDRERMFRDRHARKRRADLCEIPAREVNDWLRSLPAEAAA